MQETIAQKNSKEEKIILLISVCRMNVAEVKGRKVFTETSTTHYI